MAINTDPSASQSLDLAMAAERYTLSSPSLDARSVQLNGSELKLGEDDAMPKLTGVSTGSGRLAFPPATITFQGDATIHDLKDVPQDIMQKLVRGLKITPEQIAATCIIKVQPAGEFVTYGVGVSLQTMRQPELSRGRASV